METINYQVVELSNEEVSNIEGGFEVFTVAIGAAGAIYGAGYAVGQALHHMLN